MASPAEVVAESFATAHSYASSHTQQVAAFTAALGASIYSPPMFSATWEGVGPPDPRELPPPPDRHTIEFNPPSVPTGVSFSSPVISISEFSAEEPTLTLPTVPTVTYGDLPEIPAIGQVTIPDMPLLAQVPLPTLLAISTPSFLGVDLHTDYMDKLQEIPTLELVPPTPYSYALGGEYASELLSSLQATLASRLAGGSGIPPVIEQAIWERARDRETNIGLADEAEIMRGGEALGFHLPAGVVAAQIREAQQGYYGKLSSLSRDVAIKQAELEQENMKQTIAEGMALESKLVDQSYRMEQLAFEASKAHAENAVAGYNAQVGGFTALLGAYSIYASAYKTVIESEMAKIEVYKAQLLGEQAKADANTALIGQYKVQIEARMAEVEIYKAKVGGATALMQLEQAKVGAAAEQIKGYVAQVNAETAKVETFKASVQVEQAKADIYQSKAQAFAAKAGAQAEKARVQVSLYSAQAQVSASEWEGYRARVAAEGERIRSLGIQAEAESAAYRGGAAAVEAANNSKARMWEAQIRQYEGITNLSIQNAKMNHDATQFAYAMNMEAAKVGAQTFAQLTASAYSMVNVSAGVSGTAGTSVSYNYTNSTSSKPGSMVSI